MDRAASLAVANVNFLGFGREQALQRALEDVMSVSGEEPTESQITQIRENFSARLEFPPSGLTLDVLSQTTFLDTENLVDGSWVDQIENWPHRDGVRNYWDDNTNLPDGSKDNLDITAEHILRHSYDPNNIEEYHWRGLVVGNIQSGKTATYTKLISRAFDAGYWTVIVLSGSKESLRKQTARRMNNEIHTTSPPERHVNHFTLFSDEFRYQVNDPIYHSYRQNLFQNRSIWVTKKRRGKVRSAQFIP